MTSREREQEHQERVTDCISFTASLLKQCAPTLERFLWVNSNEKHQYTGPVSLGDLELPRLRHFRSHAVPFAPDTIVALYAAPLEELELGWETFYEQSHSNYVRNLLSLPRLTELRALALGRLDVVDQGPTMIVLQEHTHLRQLSVECAYPDFLDGHWTVYDTHFAFALWEEVDMDLDDVVPMVIDEASLVAIGTITSLERLCLDVAHITMELDDSCRHFLDHARVRKHFRGLTRLRKLAFGRQWEPDRIDQDSGHARRPNQLERGRVCERPALDKEMSWIETVKERCKLQHQQTAGMRDDSDLDDAYRGLPDLEIRKLSHRNFFLAEAEQYAGALPSLEWLFIGQWPIAISQPSSSHFGNAVPLSYGWIVSYAWEELKNSNFTLGNWDTMTHEVSEDVTRDRRIAFLRDVGFLSGHACPRRGLPRIDRRPPG
ncbi:hypothetical protein LTR17_011167 [Elasticomyces elasticus]|nr:hypothetical protein LTR17_011167 [Elasticomyces elasticus]